MCVYPVPALCNSTDTSGRLDIYRLCGLRGPMSLSVQVLETVTARAFFGQVSSGFDPLSLCRCSKPIGAVRAPVSRDWLTFQRCIRGLAVGQGSGFVLTASVYLNRQPYALNSTPGVVSDNTYGFGQAHTQSGRIR